MSAIEFERARKLAWWQRVIDTHPDARLCPTCHGDDPTKLGTTLCATCYGFGYVRALASQEKPA